MVSARRRYQRPLQRARPHGGAGSADSLKFFYFCKTKGLWKESVLVQNMENVHMWKRRGYTELKFLFYREFDNARCFFFIFDFVICYLSFFQESFYNAN